MKKPFALLLVLALVLTMAACGAEEAPAESMPETTVEATAVPTTVATTVATEPSTEPPITGTVLYPYVPEGLTDLTHYPAALEIVDGETLRVSLYQRPLYKAQELQALQPGDGIAVGGQEYRIEEIEIAVLDYATHDPKEPFTFAGHTTYFDTSRLPAEILKTFEPDIYVYLRCSGHDFYFTQAQETVPTGNGFTTVKTDFACMDENANSMAVLGKNFEVNISDFSFSINEDNNVTVKTGEDLMNLLNADPEALNLSNTSAYLKNGQLSSVIQFISKQTSSISAMSIAFGSQDPIYIIED